MSQSDTSSDILPPREPSNVLPIGALAAVLIIASAMLYHWGATSRSSDPAAGSLQSPPAATEIMVLRLDKDGRCKLNGIVTETVDLPALMKDHARRHEGSALLVEVHSSLPSGALMEVMEMVNHCGIKRTAVRPFFD